MAGKNLIHDDVFDAALAHLTDNIDIVQVRKSSGGVLVTTGSPNNKTITSADSGSPTNGSSGGRKVAVLSVGVDFDGLAVTAAGSATHIALLSSAQVQMQVNITGEPIGIGASDTVNIGSFDFTISDPSA